MAVDNNTPNKWATAGYAFWQFFDKESVVLPFTVGTYVGTKKVLNVGAGFYRAPQGTNSNRLNAPGDTTLARHDINLFAVDLFADMPLGAAKKFAITAYSVFYSHNWGPNYYRTVGIMNEGAVDPNYAGTRSQTGAGNARPLLGTGTIWYTQAGLLLPKIVDQQSAFSALCLVYPPRFGCNSRCGPQLRCRYELFPRWPSR